MKRITLAILAIAFSSVTFASGCGYPPYPPTGCHYVCMCDNLGNNCRFVLIC